VIVVKKDFQDNTSPKLFSRLKYEKNSRINYLFIIIIFNSNNLIFRIIIIILSTIIKDGKKGVQRKQ
jgi:hypothetical protein